MLKNYSTYYVFGIVDSHWVCLNQQNEKRFLYDFLKDHGFGYLPHWIRYCIAENNSYRMKYRVFGFKIHIYLSKLCIMNKIPHLETNCLPSALNTSKPTGVASQLASVSESKPSFDGVTIDDMRGNPLYQKIDDLDKIGVVQKSLVDSANKVKSKTKMIRALNDYAQKRPIPSKNSKK